MPTEEVLSKPVEKKEEILAKEVLKKNTIKSGDKSDEKKKRSEDMSFFSRIRL